MVIKYIWEFLSEREKNKFLILLCLSIIVLFFEIISIGTIFPFIYSLIDENFLDKYIFLKRFMNLLIYKKIIFQYLFFFFY